MLGLFARLARILLFAGAGLAMGLAPARAASLGTDDARHLLVRTGFGATPAEIAELAALDRTAAVDRILAGTLRESVLAPPAFVDEPFFPYHRLRALSTEERMAWVRRSIQEGLALREWWFREMLATPSPLTERMTLFWHGHFATSQQKVRSSQLVYRQNALLREHATGNFRQMLGAVSKDPAMLVYLDNAGSRRQAPNENFAREVMELFTLGEGQYTETDVKEAARAFTGWSLDRDSGEYRYRPFFHDGGVKTVLGRTGRLDGDGVLAALLEHPEAARFITRKLWREFVSPHPDEREVERLAAVFRGADYEIRPLLRALLLSQAFWSREHRGSLIKSPVELVVGTLHTFGIRPFTLRPAVVAAALLGQNVLAPPNVKGWAGGEAWINSATLLGRKQFLDRLMRGSDAMDSAAGMVMTDAPPDAAQATPEERLRRMMERGMATYAFDWERWKRGFPEARADADRVRRVVLAIPPLEPPDARLDGPALVRALAADPTYQLK